MVGLLLANLSLTSNSSTSVGSASNVNSWEKKSNIIMTYTETLLGVNNLLNRILFYVKLLRVVKKNHCDSRATQICLAIRYSHGLVCTFFFSP